MKTGAVSTASSFASGKVTEAVNAEAVENGIDPANMAAITGYMGNFITGIAGQVTGTGSMNWDTMSHVDLIGAAYNALRNPNSMEEERQRQAENYAMEVGGVNSRGIPMNDPLEQQELWAAGVAISRRQEAAQAQERAEAFSGLNDGANFNDTLDAITYGTTGSHADKDQNETLKGLAMLYGMSPSELKSKVASGEITPTDIASKAGIFDSEDSTSRFGRSLGVATGVRAGYIQEGANGYYAGNTKVAGKWSDPAANVATGVKDTGAGNQQYGEQKYRDDLLGLAMRKQNDPDSWGITKFFANSYIKRNLGEDADQQYYPRFVGDENSKKFYDEIVKNKDYQLVDRFNRMYDISTGQERPKGDEQDYLDENGRPRKKELEMSDATRNYILNERSNAMANASPWFIAPGGVPVMTADQIADGIRTTDDWQYGSGDMLRIGNLNIGPAEGKNWNLDNLYGHYDPSNAASGPIGLIGHAINDNLIVSINKRIEKSNAIKMRQQKSWLPPKG